MLRRDTQSTHDAMKLKQLLKGTHDVPEIEILFSKPKKKHETIVECPTAQLRNRKVMYEIPFILRMFYLNTKIR